MFKRLEDWPEIPVSLVPTLGHVKTGLWRNYRPVVREKSSPCTAACPASVLIPHYFDKIEHGKLDEAVEIFLLRNPFPAITGRVCPHFCQSECNRNSYDSAVSIRSVERWLGDRALEQPHPKPKAETGKRVAVVGSGPAGLAAAFYLRWAGHSVVVLDKRPKPGGLLRYGIPSYRLPKEIVDREIEKLADMGVEFQQAELGKDITLQGLKAEFDAVVLATGAWGERSARVEGEELLRSGLEFLVQVNEGKLEKPGAKVAVIGGGNTAMDVARVAKRLGSEVKVLYRRTEREMPAIKEEYEHAVEDGVEFEFLALPRKAELKDGKILLTIEKMRLGEPDESGRPRPVPTGETWQEEFDAVFKAIGEVAEMGLFPEELKGPDGWLDVKPDGSTPDPKVFAAGDLVTGPATVIQAIAAGRSAAKAVAQKLGALWPEPSWVSEIGEDVVPPEQTNPAYFPKRAGIEPSRVKAEPFAEETRTNSQEEVLQEIRRCFSCGHCNGCGTCFVFCPDAAISWVDDRPVINYDYCKGCGVCPAECPGGTIDFVKEA